MIRQTLRPVALAAAASALLLSGAAWGQGAVLRQVVSTAPDVASEYFGGEARSVQLSKFDVDLSAEGQQRPFVGLNVDTATITPGNVAEITFTLAGATFEQPATAGNLDRRGDSCSGEAGGNLRTSVMSGGARGDTSVTFRAEITGDEGLTADQAVCFWVPDLSVTLTTVSARGVTPMVRGVNVTASIKTTSTTGTTFPSRINGPDADVDMNQTTPDVPGPITMKTILEAESALTARFLNGDPALVNIADRTKIASGGTPDPRVSGPGATMGIRVGTLSLALSTAPIWKLDGGTAEAPTLSTGTLDSSLSGQIRLAVSGRFQSGDAVVVGAGPTALVETPKDGDRSVEVTTPIQVGSHTVVYVPGGTAALRPGAFAVGGTYLFNDRRNNNAMIRPLGTATVGYIGINVEGYAYGVVKGGGMETSYGRVTCESSPSRAGTCAIFADCTGQDGTGYFGAAPPITVGETVVWSSDDIAAVLGGGWDSGRGRCDIHSDGELSVQHMVRSGHALINNSTVVGRGLDAREDAARKSEIAAVKTVVDRICRSVGDDTTGATDRDGTATGEQRTACRIGPDWSTLPASN